MKKLFTLLALIATIATFAQAPQGFNYQATVRNSSGALMVSQNVYFKFNVMLNSSTSVPVFTETHYVPTDDLGAVNLIIGKGTATRGVFESVDWGNGNYYLGIELNTGNGFVAMGTTQLLSVPYALYANSSGNSQAATPNLASVLALKNNANNLQIKNLADPTEGQDAVTKSYLETIIADLQGQITALQNTAKTFVPDDNFEQYLIDLGRDDVLDNYVLTKNIVGVQQLDFTGLYTSQNMELIGIEDFLGLKFLKFYANHLNTTVINFTHNINLESLTIYEGYSLNSVDVSNNTKLIDLHISGGGNFSTLNVSQNIKLTTLLVQSVKLTNIDISNNLDLTSLNVIDSSNLTCIKVNTNQLNAIPSQWYKDTKSVYSINCNN